METEPLAQKICLTHKEIPYKHNEYKEGFLDETNHNIMLMNMLMYHPDDILVKVDRTAMAVSLETRVPMLDKDVVEFAWRLPIDYKRGDGLGKNTGFVKIPPSPLVACSFSSYLYIPVSYFALIVLTKEPNNTKSLHTLFH